MRRLAGKAEGARERPGQSDGFSKLLPKVASSSLEGQLCSNALIHIPDWVSSHLASGFPTSQSTLAASGQKRSKLRDSPDSSSTESRPKGLGQEIKGSNKGDKAPGYCAEVLV